MDTDQSATLPRQQPWNDDMLLQEIESLDLPTEDGVPMDSEWHRLEVDLLPELVKNHLPERADFYVGGNMFIHYSIEQVRNTDFLGPDFFFVKNRPLLPPRKYWAVWQEGGRFPNVIIELISLTTEKADRTNKFTIYEQIFHTPEYFTFDPFTNTIDAYRLNAEQQYVPITPNEQGRYWSEELGLWVGLWRGLHQRFDRTWLRFFNPDGSLVPTDAEAARRQTAVERSRAEAAEAELARLRALLEQQGHATPSA